ncbi:hypothetical protein P5V15_014285 [Pogonomyrmex californicus]
MSKIKEHDEQEVLKLDEHFKRILTHVRSYISNLRSIEEAHLCRIWLNKLHSSITQRNLRNEYLLELSRQLKTGTLEGIFKIEPPNDLLPPLSSSCYAICSNSSLSELSDYDRNHQNCLMLNQRSNDRNHLQNKLKIHDSDSSSNEYVAHDSTIEGNHLQLCKYCMCVLTATLNNLRIQNEQLKQELMKCQEKMLDNEAFRKYIKPLTVPIQTPNLMWKVRMLKKTITKLRKLNDTIKHVYEKKLQHIVKVLETYKRIFSRNFY